MAQDKRVTLSAPDRGGLYRSALDRRVAGVCGGLGAHLGVSSTLVRVVFVVTTVLTGGLGVVVYLFLWAVTPARIVPEDLLAERASPGRARRITPAHWFVLLGLALVVLGLSFDSPLASIVTNARILVPLLAVAVGAFVAWYQVDEQDERLAAAPSSRRRTLAIVQAIAGVAITASGVVVLVTQGQGLEGVWNGALAALAVLAGAGIVAAPFVLRMYRGLQREQAERARATERADMAAHLHDSVLQTLALIQRRSEDPQTVQLLARRQERELRSYLYAGQERAADRLGGALTTVAHDVEDEHGVPVELVVTGDQAMTPEGEALVRATREALLNAVRHGRPPVSVYAEIGPLGSEVFVRDHGDGFDLADVAEDRLGVRESILGRMARAGGSARIRRLQRGTEIVLTLPPAAGEEATGPAAAQSAPTGAAPTPELAPTGSAPAVATPAPGPVEPHMPTTPATRPQAASPVAPPAPAGTRHTAPVPDPRRSP